MKGDKSIEAVIQTTCDTKEKDDMKAIFSYLDKGIDDMESGRVHTADEAFRIIRERMKREL